VEATTSNFVLIITSHIGTRVTFRAKFGIPSSLASRDQYISGLAVRYARVATAPISGKADVRSD